MKNIQLLYLLLLIMGINNLQGQTPDSISSKGKLIIQVFGNFDYNATQDVDKKYGF